MSKFNWYLNRWLAMEHPGEDFFRLKQLIQHRFIDKKHVGSPPKIPSVIFRGFKSTYQKERLRSFLPDEASLRKYNYFNTSIDNIIELDNWSIDRKNNIDVSNKQFAHSFDYKSFKEVGEIKYVFEPARLHYFPVLASYAYAHDNEEMLSTLVRRCESFIDQNPYMNSIHWVNGIEVGIRAINLIYTRLFISLCDPKNDILKKLDEFLYLSAHYLTSHLSMYSSANNHLLAELCGIIGICSAYDFPESDLWFNIALDGMIQELNLQFHEDGFHKEACSHYHSEVSSYYMACIEFSESRNEQWHEESLRRVSQMLDIAEQFWNGGQPFTIGDSDEGHLLYPYFMASYSDEASLMNDRAVKFNRSRFENIEYDWKNYLMYGEEGYKVYQSSEIEAFKTNTEFFSSGLSFFRESGFNILMDSSPLGLKPLAAHAHADALQIILHYDGVPFLVDPGTYQYHWQYQEKRDYFISTRAHNTISVDGLNQAVIVQNFRWKDLPEVIIKEQISEDDETRVTAEHNGFLLQGFPIMHRRILRYERDRGEFEMIDLLFGEAKHKCSFYLHFHPGLTNVELKGKDLILEKDNLSIILTNENFDKAEIVKAKQASMFGWYSPSYDVLLPSSSLSLDLEFENTLEIRTCIRSKG